MVLSICNILLTRILGQAMQIEHVSSNDLKLYQLELWQLVTSYLFSVQKDIFPAEYH